MLAHRWHDVRDKGAAARDSHTRATPGQIPATRLFRRRDARELERRFAAVEREIAATAATAALADMAELAWRAESVVAVTCTPANPASGRTEVRLRCSGGTDVVVRDVPVDQVDPVADAARLGVLSIGGAARPGALFVLELRDGHSTYQLVGSRLTLEASSAPR